MDKFLVSILSICVALLGVLRIETKAQTPETYIIPTLLESESDVMRPYGYDLFYSRFRFTIEAVGGDAYFLFAGLDLTLTPDHYDYDLYVALESDAVVVTGDLGERFYQIEEGHEEIFDYLVVIRPNVDTVLQGGIKYLGWNDTPSSEAPFDIWNGENHQVGWQTQEVFTEGSTVPEPSSVLLVLLGGAALTSRRRRG